jgi:excisionase family DNA binding protein
MAHDNHLLTSTEVASLLRVSVRTVCLWAECSELPAYKVGRRWLFRRDEITNRLEQQRHDPRRRMEVPSPHTANAAIAAYSFSKPRL